MRRRRIWKAVAVGLVIAGAGGAEARVLQRVTIVKERWVEPACEQAGTGGSGGNAQVTNQKLEEANRRADQAEQKLSEMQRSQLQKLGNLEEHPNGMKLTLTGGVLFAFDSDKLLPDAQKRLEQVAEVLKQSPNARYTVEGFTDAIGSEEYNQDLSERRAAAVKDFMVSQGLSPDSLETVGFGKQDPIASNDTPEGRANNRRVEVIIPNNAFGIGGAGTQPGTQPETGTGGSGSSGNSGTGGSGTGGDDSLRNKCQMGPCSQRK